jgi:hypothetical protein
VHQGCEVWRKKRDGCKKCEFLCLHSRLNVLECNCVALRRLFFDMVNSGQWLVVSCQRGRAKLKPVFAKAFAVANGTAGQVGATRE